jgi:two-component system, cell cycle response regulator
MKTLIADDDPLTRLVLQRQLQVAGCEVIAANNGIDAWKHLDCDDPPRFAILDADMPGMTGIDIVQKLREGPGSLYTYTLLLAGGSEQHQAMEGIAAGADDYLLKPIDPQQLTARLIVARRIVKLQDQLVAACKQATFIADHDGLTGLFNHNAILKILRREMARGSRSGSETAVLMMDIDFFKKINDTHGHFIGDSVLEEVAIRIAQTVRPYDVVGRFGGEEFIVVAPNMRAGEALRFGDRIRGLIETEPVRTGDVQVPVTISVGVALGRDNMDAVLRAADAALYRAKRGGRNRVELAEEAPAESAAQA